MTTLDLDSALRTAQEIAATAQLFAAADFRDITPRRKADGSDVTDADLRIQRMSAERIRREFPEHALLAEEDVEQPADMPRPESARYCWVVDPLDGTRNFARGLACFTISIGLLDGGAPLLAVTRNLVTGAVWWALRGAGAHSGTRALRVGDRRFDRDSVVTFQPRDDGSTYDRVPWICQVHVRNFGTTALHLALVADGSIDGALCEQNHLWDIAAGALLVTEAGGVITDLEGRSLLPFDLKRDPRSEMSFIAGNGAAHQAMRAGIKP